MTFNECVRLGRSVCSASSEIRGAGPSGTSSRWCGFTHRLGGPAAKGPADRRRNTDDDRERSLEDRQGQERRHGQCHQRGMPQGSTTDAHNRLGDDHQHRRRHSGEDGGDDRGVTGAHVEGGQHQEGHHTRQHEQDPGDQPTDHPVQQPSDVDRQLLSLGPRQQGAERQGMQEALLADPTLLVDQGVLHHRDLSSRAAECLQGDREPGARGLTERDQPARARRRLVWRVGRGGHGDFLPHRPRGAQPCRPSRRDDRKATSSHGVVRRTLMPR